VAQGAKQLNRMGEALHWQRLMKQQRKQRVGKRSPRTTPTTGQVSRWFAAIPIVGLVLLAVTLALVKPGSRESLPTRPESNTSIAIGKGPVSAMPVDSVKTNDTESSDIDKATDHLNLGTDLLAHGKVEEAVAAYRQAAKLNPEDEDMHYNLALALAKQGNRKEAQEQYLEALRIYPDYTEAHNNLGNLLVADGNYGDAIAHFKEALKISPENASAHSNLGKALALQGKVTDAIPCFREAVRLNPDFLEARYNLGRAYLAQKRIDEAIAEFKATLQRRPDFAPAQRALAEARQFRSK